MIAVTVCGALIFAVIFSINYTLTTRLARNQAAAHARDVAAAAVRSMDGVLRGVEREQQALADVLVDSPPLAAGSFRKILEAHLKPNEELFGSAVAFEPGASPTGTLFAPYLHRAGSSTRFMNLAEADYNYPEQSWYSQPRESGKAVWSEPYFDKGGGDIVMSTYSVPMFRSVKGERRFIGVATADVSIDWLGKLVSGLRLHNNGYATLFSAKGVYLAHPDRSLVIRETIFTVADRFKSLDLRKIGERMAAGESGFMEADNIRGQACWIYFAQVPSTGWCLAVVFPIKAMMAEVRATGVMVTLLCAAGFALLCLSVAVVSRSVTRPLVAMTVAADQIAEGRFDTLLPGSGGGFEVMQLSRALKRMQHDLKGYLERLTAAAADRERIEKELSLAREIQTGLVPRRLPGSPFRLAGSMTPAREVGGDLYDAFVLDDGRLFFVIGDVSGKGVAAAIFMAVTLTRIRMAARLGSDPVSVMTEVNRELCRDNDAAMFVTLLCGILDPQTGDVTCANAGHNPPALIRSDGSVSFVDVPPGLVAGVMDDADVGAVTLTLSPGETLLLYTDGITEAASPDGEMFGARRMLDACAVRPDAPLAPLMAAVEAFAAGAPQADDMTLLAVSFSRIE